ncbi:hypothetical protein HYALB_00009114 [Hymenoscyphus albidus]|uniref:Uncharacterized protein n=1 Tax=Hymenoscyphus albidus TaxID=595503 RepID=A0A9N9Q5Q9_9HELO|nr:hypothetical protein HYALB_00009114 [Hymenoscyphus albidus]
MSTNKNMNDNGSDGSKFEGDEDRLESRAVAPAQTGALYKVKRHCARFWWVHVIAFCIIFLIIALCLVYVGMPRIAQHDVDASWLEVTELQFLDPTPNSVVLTQRVILHNPSKFTPTLDGFPAANYLVTDGVQGPEPMVYIQFPEIHARKPTSTHSVENQKVDIVNQEQLAAYASSILANENVHSRLIGRTSLHLGALPTVQVNFQDTPSYKGLNGLKGFNVTNVRINATKTDGPNLSGFAFIPNPSNMTIEMGNVTLSLSTDKAGIVGNTTIENFTIRPGDNSLPMSGTMDQMKVVSALDNGFLDLKIRGSSVIFNGEHIPYYEKALSDNVLPLRMNVLQVIADSSH